MVIILFGPPGSGKGTQSVFIAKKYNLMHISTGDVLRAEMELNSELGLAAKSYVQQGKLVPDDLIISMLMALVNSLDKSKKGVLLDGFPRTVSQAEALEQNFSQWGKKIDLLIDLEVGYQELIDRMLLRGEQTGRIDDTLETIKRRLQVYSDQTIPVKSYYQQLNKYVSVIGKGEIDTIFNQISSHIDTLCFG